MAGMTLEEICKKLERELAEPAAVERSRRFRESTRFAWQHLDEWRKVYPDRWIAVLNSQIVAAQPTSELLRAAAQEKGVSLAETYVIFVSKEKAEIIL